MTPWPTAVGREAACWRLFSTWVTDKRPILLCCTNQQGITPADVNEVVLDPFVAHLNAYQRHRMSRILRAAMVHWKWVQMLANIEVLSCVQLLRWQISVNHQASNFWLFEVCNQVSACMCV